MATLNVQFGDLPPEIIAEVFTRYITDISPSLIHQELANLSLVCQLWSDLINTTPALWSRISFNPLALPCNEGRITVTRVLRHIEACISHCEGLPVDLEGAAFPDFYTPRASSTFLSFMQDNSFRWKSLELTEFFEMNIVWLMFAGRGWAIDDAGQSSISWPNLEAVILQFSSSLYSPISCQFDMPKLRSVELTVSCAASLGIPRLACFPLHQLHCLSLTAFANPAKEWREALESCTSLRELHLGLFHCYIAGSKSVDTDERPTLVLPLRKLRLTQIRRFEVLEAILFNLSLPELEELEVDFETGRPLDAQEPGLRSLNPLREMIKRSGCKRLSKVSLNHGRWVQNDLVALLSLTTSLQELTVKEASLSLAFLKTLNDNRALPRLESLEMR